MDDRFEIERRGLEKYNEYKPNFKCDVDPYLPGRGTVSKFFNNIEYKNLNFLIRKIYYKN